MTRIIKQTSMITAIILCVLTILTAGCTLVQKNGGDVRNTRFFAVPFSYSINSDVSPSLKNSGKRAIFSWIKKDLFTYEEDNLFKLVKSYGQISNALNPMPDKLPSGGSLYNSQCSTSYYLRI